MRLSHIEVTGFKSIRALKLDLRRLNILIGANGSGKSNFIALFRLLNEMVEENFQLYVARQGGADTFLYFGQEMTDKITLHLSFGQNAYHCVWEPTANDRLIFAKESCWFYHGLYTPEYQNPLGSGHEERAA